MLLLIPALAFTLFPYFRIEKKYRRTRNRVVSVVLRCIVMSLAVFMISGMYFKYEVPNKENELILLVDSSYSNRESNTEKQAFLQSVVDQCGEDYKVGIVKFGYDQVYAGQLSNDAKSVYQEYLQSPDPDTTATDVASALEYARGLFTNPKTSKIVLFSDGIETDGKALDKVNEIASEGIKIDTMHYPNETHMEVQIVNVELPKAAIEIDVSFTMKVNIKSNVYGEGQSMSLSLTDNGEEIGNTEVFLMNAEQTLEITYKFEETGLHQLCFQIENEQDTLEENNAYYSYVYLERFDSILIIEKDEGESVTLEQMLKDNEYVVTSYSIEEDAASIPTDVNKLCDYEQVILVNIANKDMPAGFDEILYDYVHELGGALFTVGGNNDTNVQGDLVPHAYNRDDMIGSLYQEMLPVQVVNYTPPIAVMILIDSSGSMGSGEDSNLGKAKDGAFACLEALTSNDFCGVATFEAQYDEKLKVTPVSKRKEIENSIEAISDISQGGTVYSTAIEGAGAALSAVDVERRHIILVSDGQPSDEEYVDFIAANAKLGITMSVVFIGGGADDLVKMQEAAALGGGKCYNVPNVDKLAETMFQDLVQEAIQEIAYGEEFSIKIGDYSRAVVGIKQEDIPPLTGYYGTRLKKGAIAPLKGKYVPIYAEWDYGKGSVGSFMCDLNGTWSGKFLESSVGEQIVCNIVNALFPTQAIEKRDMSLTFEEDNYTTYMNVYTELAETDVVEVKITPVSEDAVKHYANLTIPVESSNGYTRFNYEIMYAGVYQISVQKKDINGVVLAEKSFYQTFSYSKEYDAFPDEETTGEVYLSQIAESGRGMQVGSVSDVFASFSKTIHREYDPRILFAILAMIALLLDIAARKFKFKWLHEIIRDRRAKQEYVTNAKQ